MNVKIIISCVLCWFINSNFCLADSWADPNEKPLCPKVANNVCHVIELNPVTGRPLDGAVHNLDFRLIREDKRENIEGKKENSIDDITCKSELKLNNGKTLEFIISSMIIEPHKLSKLNYYFRNKDSEGVLAGSGQNFYGSNFLGVLQKDDYIEIDLTSVEYAFVCHLKK